jgi:hypothetical protein
VPGVGASGDDGAKIHELSENANGELVKANLSLKQVADNQILLQRDIQRLQELTNQIKSNNQAIAALQKHQPTSALAALDKAAAGAKGAGDQPWFAGEDAPVPSLAMVEKTVADLQQQTQKSQSEKADLEKQRADAIAEAEKLSHQADSLSGKQGLVVYTQSASQRKTAADLSAQIDTVDAKLMLLGHDMQLATAQQKQIEAAVSQLGELSKQANSGWESIQKQMQAYTGLSRNVLQGGASAPSTQPAADFPANSVTDAVDRLNALSESIAKARSDAEAHLTAALSSYTQAATATRTLSKSYADDLRERPGAAQAAAWGASLEVFSVAGVMLEKAQIDLEQAQLQAAAAYEAAARGAVLKDLNAALEEAKLSLPSVSSNTVTAPEGDKNAAVEKARAAFDAAEKDIDAALTGTGPSRDTAKLAKIYQRYSYALLLRFIQNTDLATQKLEEARTGVTELSNGAAGGAGSAAATSFPAEITPAGAKAAEGSGPATAPSTDAAAAPATQPANAPK